MIRKNRIFRGAAFCLVLIAGVARAGLFATSPLDLAPRVSGTSEISFGESATAARGGIREVSWQQYQPHRDIRPLIGEASLRYVRFDRTHPVGPGTLLHFSSVVSEDEQLYHGGVTFDDLALSFHLGQGERFARTENSFQGLNPYFFHGGAVSDFRSSGVGGDYAFGRNWGAQFGVQRIDSDRVEERFGYYAGVSGERFYGRFSLYERGHDTAGDSIEAGVDVHGVRIEAQSLATALGARLSRLGIQVPARRAATIRFDLESGRNARFRERDDTRAFLRVSGLLGRKRHGASTTPTTRYPGFAVAARHRRFVHSTLAATAVASGALAASSGNRVQDQAFRFKTKTNAAFSVVNRINPTSVRQNREHGGWVYRNPDRTFSHTAPVAGDVASVNIGSPANVLPPGTRAIATYHTHGGPDPRYVNEQFSPQDLLNDELFGVDGYLGTPAGRFLFHNHNKDTVRRIGTVAN